MSLQKNYILFLILIIFQFKTLAQNVNISSTVQKDQKIYITYDLQGSKGKYEIKLFVKSKGSYSWSSALKSVSGNVGSNQSVGTNKQIIWDVLQDRDEFQGDWVFGIEAVNITEKERKEIEKERQKKKEHRLALKQGRMKPKNQIGYITNFTAHPFGGLNYFHFINSEVIGFYIDIRPTDSFFKRGNMSSTGSPSWPTTPCNATLWSSVYNAGISLPLTRSSSNVIMLYFGLGQARTKLYDCYEPITDNYTWYYYNNEKLINLNINFGVILQTNSKISFQLGFDSAVRKIYNTPGLNIGIGIKI